ncbi:ABC transporter substrate-binding protein [Marinobacter caseinilyticus]|uniref:ABC transporter substrate-binding protein n=1 Tax=Marinobacter caseinilyticus TaxID=2692195 RepID=UPI001F2CE9DF|nr:ABC transporter substrate-binding protein [Marinobacter caseinilyticus]
MFTNLTAVARRMFCLIGLLFVATNTGADTWLHERGELQLTETPRRVVALNWAATEALLLLGITPVGIADRDGYPVWVQDPPLPDGIEHVGARSAPSLAAIAELTPDLIITSDQLAPAWQSLQSIAPTYVISVYDQGAEPFSQARRMLLTLADILDRENRAQQVLADLERAMMANRQHLERAGLTGKPIALVSFMDARHVRMNASNGLFQAALNGLGLANARQRPGNFWGFAMVGLEAIAAMPDARLVVISPTTAGLANQLASSPFWTHLPAVRHREVYQIDPVWAYGGVNAVNRMAQLLTQALLDGGRANVH